MYLEEIIGNQYRNWKSGEWVFISAPTGTGKTTFVLNQLVPEAKNAGKEVLFLSNRTILRDQVKNIVARRQGIDADMRFLKDVEEFDGITLMSYQKVQALRLMPEYQPTKTIRQIHLITNVLTLQVILPDTKDGNL